jgi:four helix bundle protein
LGCLLQGGIVAKVIRHSDLEVYNIAFETVMQMFELSKAFPKEETYSLPDQIRRSSRSVCANLAEGWRKRRYENHFVSKLSDAEMEAGETQSWLEFTVSCSYLSKEKARPLYKSYDSITKMIIAMMRNPDPWLLQRS